jgi:hypothetical protein
MPTSRARHAFEAMSEGALAALLIVGLMAGTAFAAGGGKGDSGSSVWIEELASPAARSAGLAYGDHFTAGYMTRERQPWAHAVCYPNATTVYELAYGDGSVWGQYLSV